MYVLDASVVAKWFLEEENSDKAKQFKDKYAIGEIIIAVPDLLVYEIANLLRYKSEFSEAEVLEAIEELYNLELNIVAPLRETVKKAITIGYGGDLTVYDPQYLALAEELGMEFITADEKLYGKISGRENVCLLRDFSF